MIKTENKDIQFKIEEVYQNSQGHIFRFWDNLDGTGQKNLLAQVNLIDFDLLNKLKDQALNKKEIEQSVNLEPPEVVSLEQRLESDPSAEEAGSQALTQGQVAAFLVAGGQGTRLGFDGPKGMYPVTPVKKKSLFQLHAEKLLAIGKQHNIEIPWYIMTSITNNVQTRQFFKQNNFFGFNEDNITIFVQEMIPAIDRDGKLILDQPDHIFMNPNGHGGSIRALWKNDALTDMKNRGVEHVFYFQVDNVLTRICDPAYIGYHIIDGSEMSCKVVRKKYPGEKMGVLCRIDDRLHLIEYSDMDETDMNAKNPDGSLKLWAGNIATHLFDRRFLERENEGGFKLPYHIAEKSIPYIDHSGEYITPLDKNGIKFETFVFDALIDSRKTVCIEVDRNKEFSPLKNKEGENSPETVRRDLIRTYARWLEVSGHKLPLTSRDGSAATIEISPLMSLKGENLETEKVKIDLKNNEIYIG